MGDHLKKVRPGQPLDIPAATFNTFVDAARDYLQRQQATSGKPTQSFRQTGIVPVKNASGADAARFTVLGIDSPILSPSEAPDSFANQVAFVGVTATASHAGKFVVLLEPIADGEIGKACVAGVCPAVVNVTDAGHQFADIAAGQPVLASCASGSALILWKDSGTGLKWAVVRLGEPLPAGVSGDPKVLGGSGETADTEDWGIDAQEPGYYGVQFTPMRLYWSGVSGAPVYQFVRTPTYNSLGALVAVSAETRSVAFSTGPCEVT